MPFGTIDRAVVVDGLVDAEKAYRSGKEKSNRGVAVSELVEIQGHQLREPFNRQDQPSG
jgi:hypothetical protein